MLEYIELLKGCIFIQDTNKLKFLTGNHPNGPDVGRIFSLMGPSMLRLALVKLSPNKFCLSSLRVLCKTHELFAERNLLLLNILMINTHLIYHYQDS